jgi:hypothetical protein
LRAEPLKPLSFFWGHCSTSLLSKHYGGHPGSVCTKFSVSFARLARTALGHFSLTGFNTNVVTQEPLRDFDYRANEESFVCFSARKKQSIEVSDLPRANLIDSEKDRDMGRTPVGGADVDYGNSWTGFDRALCA